MFSDGENTPTQLRKLQQLPLVWFQNPCVIMVYGTSHKPRNGIGLQVLSRE